MKYQDFICLIIYSSAIFATFKVFMCYLKGEIGLIGAWEWFLRGFFMAWGFITCFFVVYLLLN